MDSTQRTAWWGTGATAALVLLTRAVHGAPLAPPTSTASSSATPEILGRALLKTELRDAESVSVLAARLNEPQPVRAEVAGALDLLLHDERSDTEWETWAKQQGFLR